ncbi:unnamed protein product, partial [Vitis vinifera]
MWAPSFNKYPKVVYLLHEPAFVVLLPTPQPILLFNLRSCTTAINRRAIVVQGTDAGFKATSTPIHLCDNGIADALQLLHLVLKLICFCKLVTVQPLNGVLNSIFNFLLVCWRKLGTDFLIFDSVPHVVGVVLQSVLSLNLLFVLLVVLSSARDIQDAIGINVKANSDLRDTPESRRNAREFEFAQQVIVPGSCSPTLINLDQDTRLVKWQTENFRWVKGTGGQIETRRQSIFTSKPWLRVNPLKSSPAIIIGTRVWVFRCSPIIQRHNNSIAYANKAPTKCVIYCTISRGKCKAPCESNGFDG